MAQSIQVKNKRNERTYIYFRFQVLMNVVYIFIKEMLNASKCIVEFELFKHVGIFKNMREVLVALLECW